MRIHPSRRRPENARSRGQSLVEFALVVPFILLIFAGAADLGRIFYNFVALENAVKEGAVYGSRNPLCDDASSLCPNPNNVRWRVENEARTAADTALVTPTSQCRNAVSGVAYADLRDCVAGDTYVVSASITFDLVTPILGDALGGSFTLQTQSTAVVLNQAFDPTPGLDPTKLVLATSARNSAELLANCEQPDPVGSPNYVRAPCLDVVAPIDPDPAKAELYPLYRPGDTIFYKISVINNGGTNVTGITMTDSLGWPSCATARPTSMAVNATYTCSYSRVAPAVSGSGDVMDYLNTLTVDGAEILPAVDDATIQIERPPADLQVSKVVSVYELGGSGDGPFGTADTISVFRNAQVPTPSVWFKIVVTNGGGRTATGLNVTATNGPLPTGTANCPSIPSSLAAGSSWICIYEKPYSSAQVVSSTVTATSPDATPDANDSDAAQVTVADCTGTDRVVPRLIGLVKATAVSTWNPGAGFTSTLGTWSGNNSATVRTQSQRAFSCMAQTTAMTVSR